MVREEGRGGRSELGSDLDLDPDPDPLKILRIRIRQNDTVSLLIDFVSHPKFPFRFEAKQAKLGCQFRYFSSVSLRSEIRGHPSTSSFAERPRSRHVGGSGSGFNI